jgi:hypothetical protein
LIRVCSVNRGTCQSFDRLLSDSQFLDLDITEPEFDPRSALDFCSLQGNVPFAEGPEIRPLREFTACNQLLLSVSPQLGVEYLVAVLEELQVAMVGNNFVLVPLSGGLYPLVVKRDQIEEVSSTLH